MKIFRSIINGVNMNSTAVCDNPRKDEYLSYINNHVSAVQKAYDLFLRDFIQLKYPDELELCDECIRNHDKSKYQMDEFLPYCNYYFPCEGHPKDQDALDKAWLVHQHRNPHHWQYWILVTDSGRLVMMDMPFSEIVNMVCDWHSFSERDSQNTAYSWYQLNQHRLKLSTRTRYTTEMLLEHLKDPIKR